MEDGVKRRRKMEDNSMEVCPRRSQVGKHELQEELEKKETSARRQRYDDGMYTGEKTREQAWDQLRKSMFK